MGERLNWLRVASSSGRSPTDSQDAAVNYDGHMSSLPPSSRYLQQADSAVEDTERDALSKRLSDAYTDGRLGQDEYMASLDVVYRAATLGELVPVIEQLPAASSDVPAMVESSRTPAGTVSTPRNVLLPAIVVTGAVLVLLVTIAVLVFLLIA